MWIFITTFHVLASLLLIVLVLLQQGKGADAGASFGGDSSSVFGPMVENPLKNLTTIVAMLFMITSVSLAYKAKDTSDAEGKLFSRTSSSAPAENPAIESKPVEPSNSAAEANVNEVNK